MTPSEEIIKQISQKTNGLTKFIAVMIPIGALVGGVVWYFNNVWKPSVKLKSSDYDKGIAVLEINNKARVLYAGSTINAGFGWGVRFSGSELDKYDRIEVVKNELTYKTISVSNA